MSQFLAPIHTWLFNKILVLENIERDLVNSVEENGLKEYHQKLQIEFGDYIPNQPLEEIIDETNIHGWLQGRITMAETRQAAFINKLMSVSKNAVEGINNIYYQAGQKTASELGVTIDQPAEIFQALNNVLLEGMPCDRVNSVTNQSEESITWKTQTCVHKNNWESNGVDVEYFYGFRAAFTKGFTETVGNGLAYTYTNEGEQVHTISK